MSVFGPLGHGGELEEAVVAQLRKWMPSYLLELSDRQDRQIAMPKSYSIVSEYAKFPEQGLPALIVESAGILSDSIEHDGQGFLSGTFAVEVDATVQGKDAVATRDLAMNYGLAVLGSLMQHRKLTEDGTIAVRQLVEQRFAGANIDQRRTQIAVVSSFTVRFKNFLNTSEGPLSPIEIPDDWPIVDTVEVDVERQETDDG